MDDDGQSFGGIDHIEGRRIVGVHMVAGVVVSSGERIKGGAHSFGGERQNSGLLHRAVNGEAAKLLIAVLSIQIVLTAGVLRLESGQRIGDVLEQLLLIAHNKADKGQTEKNKLDHDQSILKQLSKVHQYETSSIKSQSKSLFIY